MSLVTIVVLFIICKHTKFKLLVTNLALQQIREVGTVTKWEHFSILHDIECTCKIQWYKICMLIILLLRIVVFYYLNIRNTKIIQRDICSLIQ